MNTDRTSRSFFLHAILFLVPVLLLASVGLASLREDRALAERDAAKHASELARAISDKLAHVLSGVGRISTNLLREIILAPENRTSADPFKDPVWEVSQSGSGLDCCFLNDDFSLLYPPAGPRLLQPAPLPMDSLDQDALPKWNLARQLEYNLGHEREAIEAYRAFIELEPGLAFESAARYSCALLLRKLGQTEESFVEFSKLVEAPSGMSESGIPYSQLALLNFPLHPRIALQLRTEAISKPSPLSTVLLEKADSLNPVPSFTQLWRQHERARALFEARPGNLAELPIRQPVWWGAQSNWLAQRFPLRKARGSLVVARPASELQANAAAAVQAVLGPASYFDAEISMFGKLLVTRPEQRTILFKHAGNGITVEIGLSKPELLYAQSSKRLRLFALLIVAAVATAIVGFASAWLAYRRQVLLNNMKTNFVSSVSHELRAPLASIRLMADGLHSGKMRPEKQTQYFSFITQECQRLARLVENVLDISRIEQNRKEYEFAPANLPVLVERTVETMQPAAQEKGVQLELAITSSAHYDSLSMDAGAIQQALINLLDNAIKHSPPSGLVTIRLASSSDGMVALSVLDRGEGIPPDEQPRIFDRFYRIGSEMRRTTQGVGIGLSIVKHIVEAHGASISLRSAAGQGCEFTIAFPKPKK